MGKRLFIPLIVLGLLFSFSIYAYRIRTAYNIDKEKLHIAEHHQQIDVLRYAISLVPKEVKNEVYFNAIEIKYPDFKKDEDICDLLGHKKPEKKEEVVEKDEKFVQEDTTVKEVMNYIMD